MPPTYPIDDEKVQVELRRLFRCSKTCLAAGVGTLVVLGAAWLSDSLEGYGELLGLAAVLGLMLTVFGIAGTWGARKRRQILSRHQWRRATLRDFQLGYKGADSADIILDGERRSYFWWTTALNGSRDIDARARDVRIAGWYPGRIVIRRHDSWRLVLARPSLLDRFADKRSRTRRSSASPHG